MAAKRVMHDMAGGPLRWIVAACNWRITQNISYSGEGVDCKRCLAKRKKAAHG